MGPNNANCRGLLIRNHKGQKEVACHLKRLSARIDNLESYIQWKYAAEGRRNKTFSGEEKLRLSLLYLLL
jgi:hypothetical protein